VRHKKQNKMSQDAVERNFLFIKLGLFSFYFDTDENLIPTGGTGLI
jgi:hypothetical protein